MLAPTPIEAPAPPAVKPYDPKAEVLRLGARATRAVERVAAGREWNPKILWLAARGLAAGDRAVGVRHAYPRLAASLKRIATYWTVRIGKRLA
jgi:hypothetical protein